MPLCQHIKCGVSNGRLLQVSKKKRRYTDDGFDLDLTYITDRVSWLPCLSSPHSPEATMVRDVAFPQVIALGFPSEGREAMCKHPPHLCVILAFHESHDARPDQIGTR